MRFAVLLSKSAYTQITNPPLAKEEIPFLAAERGRGTEPTRQKGNCENLL